MSSIRRELRSAKIFCIALGIVLMVALESWCYHPTMIKHYGLTPIHELPRVEGEITHVNWCKNTKQGWIRVVKVSTNTHQVATVVLPCLSESMPRETLFGKKITAIYEKWRFPTWEKEGLVWLVVGESVVRRMPRYRDNDFSDPLEQPLTWVLFFVAPLLLPIGPYKLFKRRVVIGYRKINHLRIRAQKAFAQHPQLHSVKILLRRESFNSVSRDQIAYYHIDIYCHDPNSRYWHFQSDGTAHRVTSISKEMAELKCKKQAPPPASV